MKNLKKSITIGALVLAVGVTSLSAFAASKYNSPAEAAAGVTGKTVESVITEKTETGKTYGTIAKEAGKLDEFKAEAIEMKKDILNEKVENGTMTREKADEIIAAVEKNQENCDGTGSARIGQKLGAGFGSMNGKGQGQGQGTGRGMGSRGMGGNGICNGTGSQAD